jgi:hypothetical protein
MKLECNLSSRMWKLIQFLVVGAVVVSNAAWQWTPNGYLAGLIGWAAAFLVTVAVTSLVDALHRVAKKWPTVRRPLSGKLLQ